MNEAQRPPAWQGTLWGTLPFGSSILAILVVLIPDRRRRVLAYEEDTTVTPITQDKPVPGRLVS
jgi:hypothetical protein